MNRSRLRFAFLPTMLALALCAFLPLTTAPAGAQDANAPESEEIALPSGGEIIARYIEALGGEEALMAHSSRHVQGEIEDLYRRRIGTFDLKTGAPGNMMMTVDFPEETHVAGKKDDIVWRIDPLIGAMVHGSPRPVDSAAFDFHSELNYSKHFPLMETLGTVEVDGVECYRVRVEGEVGNERVEYYEVETGLRRAIETPFNTNEGIKSQFEISSRWEEIENVMVPTMHVTKIIEPTGQQETVQIVSYSDIVFDTLTDEDFALPEKVRAKLEQMEADGEMPDTDGHVHKRNPDAKSDDHEGHDHPH